MNTDNDVGEPSSPIKSTATSPLFDVEQSTPVAGPGKAGSQSSAGEVRSAGGSTPNAIPTPKGLITCKQCGSNVKDIRKHLKEAHPRDGNKGTRAGKSSDEIVASLLSENSKAKGEVDAFREKNKELSEELRRARDPNNLSEEIERIKLQQNYQETVKNWENWKSADQGPSAVYPPLLPGQATVPSFYASRISTPPVHSQKADCIVISQIPSWNFQQASWSMWWVQMNLFFAFGLLLGLIVVYAHADYVSFLNAGVVPGFIAQLAMPYNATACSRHEMLTNKTPFLGSIDKCRLSPFNRCLVQNGILYKFEFQHAYTCVEQSVIFNGVYAWLWVCIFLMYIFGVPGIVALKEGWNYHPSWVFYPFTGQKMFSMDIYRADLVAVDITQSPAPPLGSPNDDRPFFDKASKRIAPELKDYQLAVQVKTASGYIYYKHWEGLSRIWYKRREGYRYFSKLLFAPVDIDDLKKVRLDHKMINLCLNRKTLLANRDDPAVHVERALRMMEGAEVYQEDYQRLLSKGGSVYRDVAAVCGCILSQDPYKDSLHF